MGKKTEASELDILYPERVLTLAGETVTVQELSFAQTLRLEASMAPLIQAFIDLPVDGDGEQVTAQLWTLFGEHAQAWIGFVATACGLPREWVEQLSDADGRALSMAVWSVNAAFFTRRVISGMIARRSATSAPLATPNCTPH